MVGMVKKAYYFSLDALIAVLLIIVVTSAFSYFYVSNKPETQHTFYSSDLVEILSTLKVGEITDPEITQIIENSDYTDPNITITEQIGRFWALGEIELAKDYAQAITGSLIPEKYGVGIYISVNSNEQVIFSNEKDFTNQLVVSKQMVSGLEEGHGTVKGSMARVFLTGINSLANSAYLYFGGYVGNGDISKILTLPQVESISEMYMEMSVGQDFTLYINDVYSGSYAKSDTLNAVSYSVNQSYLSSLHAGDNNIKLVFQDKSGYIGGGFIRIDYISSDLSEPDITYDGSIATKKYHLPGIDGFINLYSSFYIPGNLQNMNIHLRYFANRSRFNSTLFFNIGDNTIFQESTANTEQVVEFSDLDLSMLDYNQLSQNTIPFRISFRNFTAVETIETPGFRGDTVLITDLSGSMDECDIDKTGYEQVACPNNPSDPDAERLEAAKFVNKDFVSNILNNSDNRVGLASYATSTISFTDLTTDQNQLTSDIDEYSAGGWTCISCGIHKAAEMLTSDNTVQLNSDQWKYSLAYEENWQISNFNDNSWSSGSSVLGFNNVDTEILPQIYADLWDMEQDTPNPVDFTSGMNSSANTFASQDESTNDGWDWARGDSAYGTHGDNRNPGDFPMSSHYDPSQLTDGLPHDSSERIEVEVGGTRCGYYCGYMDSAAFGIQFEITEEMISVLNNGGKAFIQFNYEAFDRETLFGNDDTEESVWIKSRFGNSQQMNYLGYDLDTNQGSGLESGSRPEDSSLEILYDYSSQDNLEWEKDSIRGDFDMDQDSNYNKGTFMQEVTQYISQPGWYYLDFGAKFDASGGWMGENEGIIAYFDNIAFTVNNISSDFYFRQKFNIDDLNQVKSLHLSVYSDDKVDVYLNENLIAEEQNEHQAEYWNIDSLNIPVNNLNQGENTLAVKLYNDDAESAKFDLELRSGQDLQKAMLVMSDGEANYCHGPYDGGMDSNSWNGNCYDSQARQETVDFACYAHENYNISIYTIAFGDSAGTDTLQQAACCDDCSHFYFANNISSFLDTYRTIAEQILNLNVSVKNQTIIADEMTISELFSDSYIEVKYLPDVPPLTYGIIPFKIQGERFGNDISEGDLNIPKGYDVREVKVTSYSGDKWTDSVQVYNQGQYSSAFNLSQFSHDYSDLGDPYIVNIPVNLIQTGETNKVKVTTGSNASVSSGGSADNRIIYTLNLNALTDYTGAYTQKDGCLWFVEFEDSPPSLIPVPSDYSGSDLCNFTTGTYDNNDAVDNAVFELFTSLDLDNNKKIITNINSQNIEVNIISQDDIPFMWGPATVEVRIWE